MTAYFKIPSSQQIDAILRKGKSALGAVLDIIYPPRCLSCVELTEKGANLCSNCWSDTTFITGAVCGACGTPLQGETSEQSERCDTCIVSPPKWQNGCAAVLYNGGGRRAVLALKHGDRLDMAKPLAEWMARAGTELLNNTDAITPVPLHRGRLFRRRFNQSAELARHLAKISGKPYVPDLLIRTKATKSQDGLSWTERHQNQQDAFKVNPRRDVPARVLIVDDVMTTGATMSACATTLKSAGCDQIDALVLARVARTE